ncbi:hypothetical protein Q5P01_008763 [Channa striata]|uniref:Mid1-interacting protein 1 n=1 Tax=Channa striata TaxID=64152 RepID=A0AA88SWS4_CHASR|nr:hypothetical protein Q5P01_008763 [Channa striata]
MQGWALVLLSTPTRRVRYKFELQLPVSWGRFSTYLEGGWTAEPEELVSVSSARTGFLRVTSWFRSALNHLPAPHSAANNMDETIMVPSLLRDMPLEEQAASEAETNNNIEPQCPNKQKDMYEHYLLLKSIKNDMEWGLLKKEMSSSSSFLDIPVKQEKQQEVTGDPSLDDNSDLENQFHYHLRGLFGVLSKLTLQADDLTNRYKREIGGGNFMR